MEDAYFKLAFFEGIKDSYTRPHPDREPKGYSSLIWIYLSLILEKIHFHKRHPQFTGDFSLESYLGKNEKLTSDKR